MSTQSFRNEKPMQGVDENLDLYEEELSAEKHLHDHGEVRLKKRVVTTQKQITVPVMHEEVMVERIPYETPTREPMKTTTSDFDEIRVPLCEEEASAEKYTRPLGEVRIHKRIVTTQKQITVPVMHEEIRVERVPANERKAVEYSDGMFVESTQIIPLHDEEVEIHKYPVLREGVRLRKAAFQEDRTATADLRKEELDVEEIGAQDGSWKESRERTFSEDTQVIPLYEEEVEIRKYPVMREEVRVNRAALQEERIATTETLREELDVEQPQRLTERYRGNGGKGSNGSNGHLA